MTEKLYDYYPYETKFEGKVLSCVEDKLGYKVELDRTLFFPEEGGQTPDQGTLDGQEVVYVSQENGQIFHFLGEKVEIGRTICGIVEWSHRRSNMQMHSAEHIFSGLVHKRFGYDNVGFHLSDNDATMDYNGRLSGEDISLLEREVNEAIWKALKINTWYPDEDELGRLDYRAKSGIEGQVRMVEIESIDLCACCAPHVKNTSEIGIFKIVKYENYKGGIRLHYLAGERAYNFLNSLQISFNDVSRLLSSSTDKVAENVLKLQKDNAELSFEIGKIKRESLEKEIADFVNSDVKGSANNILAFFIGNNNADLLRFGIDKMLEVSEKVCFIYSGNDDSGYRFVLEGHGEPIRDKFEMLKEALPIKGGGKDASFQGTIASTKLNIEKNFL